MSKKTPKRGNKSPRKKTPRRTSSPKKPKSFFTDGDNEKKPFKSRHQIAKERKAKIERDERIARKKAEEGNVSNELAGVEGLGVMATAHIYIPIEKKQRKTLRVTELEEGTVDSEEELVREILLQSNSLRKEESGDLKKEVTQAEEKVEDEKSSPQGDEVKVEANETEVANGTGPSEPVAKKEATVEQEPRKDDSNVQGSGDEDSKEKQEDIDSDLEEPKLRDDLLNAGDEMSVLRDENELIQAEVQKLRHRVIEQDRHIESLNEQAQKQKTLLKNCQREFDERLNQRTTKLEQIHLQELQEKMELRRKEAQAEVREELEELQDQIETLKKEKEQTGKETPEDNDLTETLLSVNKALEDEVEQMKVMHEESKQATNEIITAKLQFVQKSTAEIGRLTQELNLSRATVVRLQLEQRATLGVTYNRSQSTRKCLDAPRKEKQRPLSARVPATRSSLFRDGNREV